MFNYQEKRFGKKNLIIFAIVYIVLALALIAGGIVTAVMMSHWAKYIILGVAIVIGLVIGSIGVTALIISFSTTGAEQSVRDGNRAKGIANTTLCDKCGREITENTEFCASCGAKQTSSKIECPNCKTANKGTAQFCEKCGYEFKN